MEVHYCDICNKVFKHGEQKYAMGVSEIVERKELQFNSLQEFQKALEDYERARAGVKVYEICEECKKIFNYLFKMRRQELEKIRKQIEDSFNAEGGSKNGKTI